MEANGSADQDGFEDFEPFCVWQRFADRDVLEIHLQGFKKENLRVQLTDKNILIVTGDRSLNDGKKRSRFEKKIELSREVNTKEIRAKLGGCGALSLIMPKKLNLIQGPKQSNGGESKREDGVTSRAMKFKDGIGMKLRNSKKIGPMLVVVVLAAIVGFGAFIAQKYMPKYPVEN